MGSFKVEVGGGVGFDRGREVDRDDITLGLINCVYIFASYFLFSYLRIIYSKKVFKNNNN